MVLFDLGVGLNRFSADGPRRFVCFGLFFCPSSAIGCNQTTWRKLPSIDCSLERHARVENFPLFQIAEPQPCRHGLIPHVLARPISAALVRAIYATLSSYSGQP